ncbi:hypothetical protein [Steroidobacter agaridevorans]|uniref:hypothetical protein n=1 Tax=Steroidobacter agaridevorans TaxID=2695856 RepID=UPI001326406C|nr:hypothetical protein [Steroidobacter agaridevorans]GFE87082.1 hypothetical protein GCM10011488_20360 [Steroidobacter agaridevorans]
MIRAAIVLLACSVACVAQAQVQRSGNADARVAQQLQQLTSEKSALQAENDKLKQELEQAKAQLQKYTVVTKDLDTRNKALIAAAGKGSTAIQQLEEQLERGKAQNQELVGKFRETAQALRDVEAERVTLKSQMAAKERDYKLCVDRNVGLYKVNDEILDRMEDRGFWSQVTEREPFTRIQRTRLENLIDDYRYRADEQRLELQP